MNHAKYSAEQVADVLTECKGMITIAAKRLGCVPNTVRRYVRDYACCRQALEDAREAMGDTAELALYKAIQDGEGWAIAFYLRTQGRNRGYVERQEIDGLLKHIDLTNLSTEQLERLANGDDPIQILLGR